MQLVPYVTFNGNCEEAMSFYKDCLGGEFESINYFRDGPPEIQGGAEREEMSAKVMHMTLRFDENVLMASDSTESVVFGRNIALSVSINDIDKMEKVFNNLSAGGEVTMPLQDTFWGARFGTFTDRFGINWMFNCDLGK